MASQDISKTIRDKTSAMTADVLKRYIDRMQLMTGKHFNIIAVCQGTEFDGEFLDLIKTMCLTKLKATAYQHHLPPKAERANQTLMKFGRTLLLASRLPAEFYSGAQLMACFILNRLVHAGKTISPYEIMYGIRPQISHLHPFGTICYVFVPQGRRTKLANVQEKVRLMGFGDDDSSEEIKGYKVVTELDSKIVLRSDVMSCAEEKIWKEAEQIGLGTLKEKETFGRCTDIPLNRKPVRSKWVYSKKCRRK